MGCDLSYSGRPRTGGGREDRPEGLVCRGGQRKERIRRTKGKGEGEGGGEEEGGGEKEKEKEKRKYRKVGRVCG